MKNRVTIIPADRLVIVDGLAIKFPEPLATDEIIHAIQWNGNSGHIEHGQINEDISGQKDYDKHVKPFVVMWEKEKARIEEEQNKPLTEAQLAEIRIAEIKQVLAEIDQKRIRPLAEGDTVVLAELNEQARALRLELQQLIGEVPA